jgi:predicted acylesterase/phospholipase RssA
MSETRIALIMGGGVSLGSFSGGATSRIIKLLKEVKRGPARIDVMSGASAGSMTLGVVAHHLFMGASDEEIEEALYSAWVDQIDLEHLIPRNFGSHRTPSLFSDEIIEHISMEKIQTEDWTGLPGAPHPLFAEGMRVSFSLTNLNGIPVRSEGQIIRQTVSGGGSATGKNSVFADAVQTTFHHDVIRFELRRDPVRGNGTSNGMRILQPWNSDQSKNEWNVFRKAAIASGAFPGAFPPARLLRRKSEYGKWWPEELEAGQFTFDYLDGGITRNEPLREAIHMAADLDEDTPDVERVFILVDPNVSGTNEVYPLSYNQLLSLKREHDKKGKIVSMHVQNSDYLSNLGGVIGRFLGVLSSQATFRDWLKAAHFNSLIEWKDDLIEILDKLQIKPDAAVSEEIDGLLQDIYRTKKVRSSSKELTEMDLKLIDEKIKHDIQKNSKTNDADDFIARLKLLVTLAANLNGKRKLNMVAITPASIEGGGVHRMAGDFMKSFGGFFEKRYREYDFNVGKYIANKVLTAPISNEEGTAKKLLNEGIDEVKAPDPILPSPAYSNVDETKQKMMEQFLKNHLETVISSFPIPTKIIRNWMRDKIAGNVTKSLMAQSSGHTHYVCIRFQNVKNDWLLKGSAGKDAKTNGKQEAETIIGIRMQLEGARQFELFGPHLHEIEGSEFPEFQFYRKYRRPWKNGEVKQTIPVQGSYSEWYKKACFNSTPCITCELKEESVQLMPSQVLDMV